MLTKEELEYLLNFNNDTNQDDIDKINELIMLSIR